MNNIYDFTDNPPLPLAGESYKAYIRRMLAATGYPRSERRNVERQASKDLRKRGLPIDGLAADFLAALEAQALQAKGA